MIAVWVNKGMFQPQAHLLQLLNDHSAVVGWTAASRCNSFWRSGSFRSAIDSPPGETAIGMNPIFKNLKTTPISTPSKNALQGCSHLSLGSLVNVLVADVQGGWTNQNKMMHSYQAIPNT